MVSYQLIFFCSLSTVQAVKGARSMFGKTKFAFWFFIF